jgi:hypothetical protein
MVNHLLVTEGRQVVCTPPLVSEEWFSAQVFQGAQNEARPFTWHEQKARLHCQWIEEGIKCFGSR